MNESYNEIIRKARTNRRITSKGVAEMVGISPIYFCRIEKGKAKPSIEVLEKICTTLNLNFQEIARKAGYSENKINPSINCPTKKVDSKIIICELEYLSAEDFELIESLIKQLPNLTDKEKDTIKFIISYKNTSV